MIYYMIIYLVLLAFLFILWRRLRAKRDTDATKKPLPPSDPERTTEFTGLSSSDKELASEEEEEDDLHSKPSDFSAELLENGNFLDLTSPLCRGGRYRKPDLHKSTGFWEVKRPRWQKYALRTRWALWHLQGNCEHKKESEWRASLKKVGDVKCKAEFWTLYGGNTKPSDLPWGSDYNLFKEDISPMWEDPANVKGGRWLIVVPKSLRTDFLDRWWRKLVAAVMGLQFADCVRHICGVAVKVRKEKDMITVWTRNADDKATNLHIGHLIKKTLDIPPNRTISYVRHNFVGPTSRPKLMYSL